MQKSEKETVSAFNISFSPPPTLSKQIMALNERIKALWNEDFILGSAHLTLYYTIIPEKNIPKLKDILSRYVRGLKPVIVTLGNIIVADNYIMIETEKNNTLLKINRDLVSLLSPLREGVIMQKYLLKWDSFSEEKRDLIIRTGHQYPYTPHLTIANVKEGTVDKAWNMIKDVEFKGISFTAKSIELHVADEEMRDQNRKNFSYKIEK